MQWSREKSLARPALSPSQYLLEYPVLISWIKLSINVNSTIVSERDNVDEMYFCIKTSSRTKRRRAVVRPPFHIERVLVNFSLGNHLLWSVCIVTVVGPCQLFAVRLKIGFLVLYSSHSSCRSSPHNPSGL
jgi:hypothetical protein